MSATPPVSVPGRHCKPLCRDCRRTADLAYRVANRHRYWAGSYRARARDLGLPLVVVEEFTESDVIGLYGNGCVYCPSGDFEQLDHYVPVVDGGPHTLANVRPSCAKCNIAKSKTERSDLTRISVPRARVGRSGVERTVMTDKVPFGAEIRAEIDRLAAQGRTGRSGAVTTREGG